VDVERLRGAEPVRIPDLVDEPLPRHDAARLAQEQLEELELLAGQIQILPIHARCATRRVQRNCPDLQRARSLDLCHRPLADPPQDSADARGDLTGAERLHDVVVGAELEADDAIGLLTAGGEHDDRDLGVLAQRAGHVVA
jgi:hypothetical protein